MVCVQIYAARFKIMPPCFTRFTWCGVNAGILIDCNHLQVSSDRDFKSSYSIRFLLHPSMRPKTDECHSASQIRDTVEARHLSIITPKDKKKRRMFSSFFSCARTPPLHPERADIKGNPPLFGMSEYYWNWHYCVPFVHAKYITWFFYWSLQCLKICSPFFATPSTTPRE